jgi:serine/threonine-protein kinase
VEPGKTEKFAKTIRIDERLRERRVEAATPPGVPALGPGSMLGNYQIVNLVGEGGMGMVYKAQDTVLDRTVALKVLPPHLTQNPDFMHRFRTEAYAQARLQHPNIVTLYSVLEVPAGFVLVMEYVQGRTLREHIQGEGPLAPAEAARIFEQALQGAAYAHHMGVVHRDLKPDNIFLTHKQEVKIMDFGVAKIIDSKEPTRSRSMVGTLLYISPEQINGRDADFRSDVYTLGIGLFEAVTGRLPFERRTDYGLMHAHVLEKPPHPRRLKRDLPKELEKVILRAIEKEPDRRFQSAAEFRAALLKQSARYGLALPAAAADPAGRLAERLAGRNRLLGDLGLDALLIAAALVLALALGLYPGRERPPDEVEPVTHLVPKAKPTVPAAAPSAPTPTPARSSGERAPAAAPTTPAPPRGDRYDTLRKAWGG